MEEFEIEVDDLLNALGKNVKKDIKTFEDLVNLDCSLNREIIIEEIGFGCGIDIDGMIRYWNRYDDKHNIPLEKRQPILLIIDSCGGSLSDAFTIIDSIKNSKTPIIGICIGSAYSAGFFILISCHKRYAYPHASFLFHEGSAGNSGTAAQFANFAAFYKKQLNQLKDIVIENTNISKEEYQEIKKDDIWYDAEEALKKKIIDKIIEDKDEI